MAVIVGCRGNGSVVVVKVGGTVVVVVVMVFAAE